MSWCVLLVATLGLLGVVACSGDGRWLGEVRGMAMGTQWSVRVVTTGPGSGTTRTVREITEGQLDLVNARMSRYLESSDVSRFNESSETTSFPVSPETADVVRHALEIGALTSGALDVTVAPLVDAWGFGPRGESLQIPSEEDVEHLLTTAGLELLRLDPLMPAITKTTPGLRIDLSAVAKGYAVDRVAEALIGAGFKDLMVEIGGEIRVHGHNSDGDPWRLAIERPDTTERSFHTVLSLSRGSLATSGDYRLFREIEGRRISHIMDPRSGRPVEHRLASVSVVDDLCVRADAFATALMVLGPDEGLRLAEELGLAAFFLVRGEDGQVIEMASSAFRGLLTGNVDGEDWRKAS